MGDIVLKTKGLCKTYRKVDALSDINMTIKKGDIYGLIGMNGAGKSTLIRLITGLAPKTSGNMELFGENEEKKIEQCRRRIGAIVERPGLYPSMTVYKNMELNKIQKGIPGNECIENTLNIMDLIDVKDKKVRSLSLGIKQKLGIAMALLGEPEFLILDEPINGVDPIGIVKIREILKKLNEEKGVTILISSHILKELYSIATCYGIIHKGKLIQEITSEELKERCKKFIHIKVNDVPKASVIINSKLKTSNFKILPNNIINLYDYVDNTGKVSSTLLEAGIMVEQIMPKGENLESYFSKVVGGNENV